MAPLLTSLYFSTYLSSLLETRAHPPPLRRHIFSADVAVQTDSVIAPASPPAGDDDLFVQSARPAQTDEDVINKLTSADLASILRWSKEISRDINLSLALQTLTEIATGECQPQISLQVSQNA